MRAAGFSSSSYVAMKQVTKFIIIINSGSQSEPVHI
jgi:hypothetical protein